MYVSSFIMAAAPFFLPALLIVSDGDLNLPEYLCGNLADSRSQCIYCTCSIKIENFPEIFLVNIIVQIIHTTAVQCIRSAD